MLSNFLVTKLVEESDRAISVLVISTISFLTCQLIKSLMYWIKEKKFDIKMLVSTGGFPSSHTSTVTTMVTSIGIFQICDYGKINYVFAVAAIVAIVIIHDACGVRYEASKHAIILNKMVENETFEEKKKLGFGKKGYLKELLGHKKSEVIAGLIYGILVAVIGSIIVL